MTNKGKKESLYIEVDNVTVAFLQHRTEEIKKGKVELSEPISAEEWAKRTQSLFVEAKKRARQKTPNQQ
jgi:hypothetical protein